MAFNITTKIGIEKFFLWLQNDKIFQRTKYLKEENNIIMKWRKKWAINDAMA